jgi:hypothetical protein
MESCCFIELNAFGNQESRVEYVRSSASPVPGRRVSMARLPAASFAARGSRPGPPICGAEICLATNSSSSKLDCTSVVALHVVHSQFQIRMNVETYFTMTSGVEIAGLVLASMPLVVSALEHYIDGIGTLERWWRYKREVNKVVRLLAADQVLFQGTDEKLLNAVLTPTELEL